MIGRIVGAAVGFVLFRWLGALLGFYLGYRFDKKQQVLQVLSSSSIGKGPWQALFFYSTFAMMGHIAKANGRVSEVHIAAASALMTSLRLTTEQMREAQAAFREGKDPDFQWQGLLQQLKTSLWGRSDLLQLFVELQIQLAYCDGELAPAELQILQQLASQLGFSARQLTQLCQLWQHVRFGDFSEAAQQRSEQQRANHQQHQQHQQRNAHRSGASQQGALAQAYQLLGVTATDGWQTIKRAYKKQMAQHHPDKLVSQGLPANMMQLAKEKTQAIQAAYELIKQHHTAGNA